MRNSASANQVSMRTGAPAYQARSQSHDSRAAPNGRGLLGGPLTEDLVMALQRDAGNRATSELITLQRSEVDAGNFAERHGLELGYSVNRRTVKAFVEDRSKDKGLRRGLLDAWNRDYRRPLRIPVPPDLAGRAAPFDPGATDDAEDRRGMKRAAPVDLSFDRKNTKKMRPADHIRVRRDISDDEGEDLDVEQYREADEAAILLSSGYTASKSNGTGNWVSGPGRGKSTRYPDIVPRVSEAVGGDTKLAALLEKGLLNMPAFEMAISDVPAKVKDQVRFVLVLMINEVIGRSTPNLVDIMATLQHTQKVADDKSLADRLLEQCLFAPAGGQAASRIGHGDLDPDTLSDQLQQVLANNQAMYYSLAENLGARTPDQLVRKFKGLYERFKENFETHVMIWYD